MKDRIMRVFYDNDFLPYKDKAREVHYPIVGNEFVGASNVSSVRFYIDRIDEDNTMTFVANTKLQNGSKCFELLSNRGYDEELNERYVELTLSSKYTTINGYIYISLNGYSGEVKIDRDEETGVYTLHGTPTITATGVIKLNVNYAVNVEPNFEISIENYQLLLSMIQNIKERDFRHVKWYDNITKATEDKANLRTNQVVFIKEGNIYKPYYLNSGGQFASFMLRIPSGLDFTNDNSAFIKYDENMEALVVQNDMSAGNHIYIFDDGRVEINNLEIVAIENNEVIVGYKNGAKIKLTDDGFVYISGNQITPEFNDYTDLGGDTYFKNIRASGKLITPNGNIALDRLLESAKRVKLEYNHETNQIKYKGEVISFSDLWDIVEDIRNIVTIYDEQYVLELYPTAGIEDDTIEFSGSYILNNEPKVVRIKINSQEQINFTEIGLVSENVVDSKISVVKSELEARIEAIESKSDVVDIVGTKAQLDTYDTSKLGDNDIIKVLADETHSNATAYYSYNKESDSFSYVGSEGPYYTQTESDAKYLSKEDAEDDYATKNMVINEVNNINTQVNNRIDSEIKGIKITALEDTLIEGTYSVPKLNAEQVLNAYNLLNSGRNCVIESASGEEKYSVDSAQYKDNHYQITIIYKNLLILTYTDEEEIPTYKLVLGATAHISGSAINRTLMSGVHYICDDEVSSVNVEFAVSEGDNDPMWDIVFQASDSIEVSVPSNVNWRAGTPTFESSKINAFYVEVAPNNAYIATYGDFSNE